MNKSYGFPLYREECKKCHSWHYCQRHKPYPQEFFKIPGDNVSLCYDCHAEFHLLIGSFGKMRKYEYDAILQEWLSGRIYFVLDVLILLGKFSYLRRMAKLNKMFNMVV